MTATLKYVVISENGCGVGLRLKNILQARYGSAFILREGDISFLEGARAATTDIATGDELDRILRLLHKGYRLRFWLES